MAFYEGVAIKECIKHLRTACRYGRVFCLCVRQQEARPGMPSPIQGGAEYRLRIGLNPFATFDGMLISYHSGTRLSGHFLSEPWIWMAFTLLASLAVLWAFHLITRWGGWAIHTVTLLFVWSGVCFSLWGSRSADQRRVFQCLEAVVGRAP